MLDHPRSPAYDVYDPATAGTGRRKPVESTRRDSAILQALFLCLQFTYGGLRGAASRLAGVLVDRFFLAPRSSATIPLGKGTGGLQTLQGVLL